jgi:hypothetical protein
MIIDSAWQQYHTYITAGMYLVKTLDWVFVQQQKSKASKDNTPHLMVNISIWVGLTLC